MSHKIHLVKTYNIGLAQWLKSHIRCICFGNEPGMVTLLGDGDDHSLSQGSTWISIVCLKSVDTDFVGWNKSCLGLVSQAKFLNEKMI